MKPKVILFTLLSLWIYVSLISHGDAKFPEHVIILYNDSINKPFSYADFGLLHAKMLNNLLGHYPDLEVRVIPASKYNAGDATRALRTFYIGTTFDETVPKSLIDDVESDAPITWINYNLWQLSSKALKRLGIQHVTVHTANTPEEYEITFNRIEYRSYIYSKQRIDMTISEIRIEDSRAITRAWAVSNKQRIPYATQNGNFWFIADDPFTYIQDTDRYLVFADLLGSMLGREESCKPRAIIRIEDVSANDSPDVTKSVLDVFEKLQIPFAINIIPQYDNSTQLVNWPDRPLMLAQLKRAENLGGRVFQHGYKHMYEGLRNPLGSSGDDFEFWNAQKNAPIDGLDSKKALERVRRGKQILENLGLHPIGWVTPHYFADPMLYPYLNTVYPLAFERRQYQAGTLISGQFFPYPVTDVYGTKILPENLGNIQKNHSIQQMLEIARANRGLHCPWAGLFVHALLLNSSNTPISTQELENFIREIQRLGYQFVDPVQVFP